MGNGMCERFNRTLLNMLGSLEPHQKQKWKAYLGPMVHAYNCTRHESTGQTPYLLMFGRNPRLPIDVTLGLRIDEQQPSSKCIAELRDHLSQAYQLATEAAEKARQKQKEGYDVKIRGAVIKPGDRVLVKTVVFDGKHKLADKWEPETYLVVSQPNDDIPVYTVRKENGEGRTRTLHRNLLLPIGYVVDTPTPIPRKKQHVVDTPTPAPRRKREQPIPAKRRSLQKQEEQEQPQTDNLDDSSSDESDDGYLIISQEPVYSDSSITEDSLVQPTEDTFNADDGDAYPSTDTDGSVSEDHSADRSASPLTLPEIRQEDTPDSESSQSDVEDNEETQLPVRRSTRERRPPSWFTSGDYDTSKSAVTSKADWEKRVNCIISLATESDLLKNLQNEAGHTILDILRAPLTNS